MCCGYPRSDGAIREFALSRALRRQFLSRGDCCACGSDIVIVIDETPNELPDPIRFSQDNKHAAYDPNAVRRFFHILLGADRVFKYFRTGFLGKASPVHFFWGSFDLAVTRFSGRSAPRHPGGVPHLSDDVACEAYSHEVSSAGILARQRGNRFSGVRFVRLIRTAGFPHCARETGFGLLQRIAAADSILPYDAMRAVAKPDDMLLEFLQTTYEAAANAAHWDRAALECALGQAVVRQPKLRIRRRLTAEQRGLRRKRDGKARRLHAFAYSHAVFRIPADHTCSGFVGIQPGAV